MQMHRGRTSFFGASAERAVSRVSGYLSSGYERTLWEITRTFVGHWHEKKPAAAANEAKRTQHIPIDIDPSLVFTMAAVAGFVAKALSPSYYSSQWSNFLVKSHAYYHPKFRAGR
jgi:hypothetical protein